MTVVDRAKARSPFAGTSNILGTRVTEFLPSIFFQERFWLELRISLTPTKKLGNPTDLKWYF